MFKHISILATALLTLGVGCGSLGGGSLIEGHPLERLYREVRSMRFVEGASDILRINIARGRIEFDSGRL